MNWRLWEGAEPSPRWPARDQPSSNGTLGNGLSTLQWPSRGQGGSLETLSHGPQAFLSAGAPGTLWDRPIVLGGKRMSSAQCVH